MTAFRFRLEFAKLLMTVGGNSVRAALPDFVSLLPTKGLDISMFALFDKMQKFIKNEQAGKRRWMDYLLTMIYLSITKLWNLKSGLQLFFFSYNTFVLQIKPDLRLRPVISLKFFFFLPHISVLTISFCKSASCTSMSTCHRIFLCPSVCARACVCKSRYYKWLSGHGWTRGDMSGAVQSVCSVCSSGASNQISCN